MVESGPCRSGRIPPPCRSDAVAGAPQRELVSRAGARHSRQHSGVRLPDGRVEPAGRRNERPNARDGTQPQDAGRSEEGRRRKRGASRYSPRES